MDIGYTFGERGKNASLPHSRKARQLNAKVLARLCCSVLVCTGGIFMPSISAAAVCPASPVPSVTSATAPEDVCIPDHFPPSANPIQFFDDYSWKSFVAMVWPAAAGQRGLPDMHGSLNTAGPRVFETFKNDWELFKDRPTAWSTVDTDSPCAGVTVGPDDLVLASFTKFGNLGQAGFGKLVHALPAQNRAWVRYSTGINRLEYDKIVENNWFVRDVLNQTRAIFPNGAVDVKAAWIDMAGVQDPERYYTRMAWVEVPGTKQCKKSLVGLIGFHIVQKTTSRPQWIWSTFEQVDTVPPNPPLQSEPAVPFVLNDGHGNAMPSNDPNGGFPPTNWDNPQIYSVTRLKPIHASTSDTNQGYKQLLANTVWRFYRLVMTQWPLQLSPEPIPPTQSGDPQNTFPGVNAASSFANVTMETWEQRTISTGCMACHTATQEETDFLWSLEVNAITRTTDNRVMNALGPKSLPPSIRTLGNILQEGQDIH